MKIFVSHSSKDGELATLLVDLLRSSLNLSADTIRCTSVDGHRLAGGETTDQALRKEIRDCEAFVGLISATSIESAYVLFELGARWGVERHLLPLLSPTADAKILRGPLSGLNALSCSRAADLHQMVHEIGAVLGVSPEKPASYQRHIDQILGWGAIRHSTSQTQAPISPSISTEPSGVPTEDYQDAEEIIQKHCEEQWPDDYGMRDFCITEQQRAVAELRSGRPENIPEDVFRKIRSKAAADWPSDYAMRLFTEQGECKSYLKLQQRRRG